MKKSISIILIVLLLISCISMAVPSVYAKKTESSRAIAIVFDNSGSMYIKERKDWCRATYAMEVFASMLNKGDVLQIYPMHPITIGQKEYTMDSPFVIADASQAPMIRDIFTKNPQGTPVETIDAAANGLKTLTADKKYMVVLTDGDVFYKNNAELSKDNTKKELDSRFNQYAGEEMTVMYLGIGGNVSMPTKEESQFFVKRKAENSSDVLSTLTDMCNQIFGRDTLPKSHLTSSNMKLDISINKLIVFVQGENVTDLKVTGVGGAAGKLESTASTKYSTKGSELYKSVADTSLQGMMVTYTDCNAGDYKIEYKGNATSVEVYYEPNADLDFVFTDSEGNLVDPKELYEGEYKVSFGMKDAKTGQLIISDLLGEPKYEGCYSVNGEKHPFSQSCKSGEVPVELKMNDAFDANLTVTYLSGYVISKDSTDFGWPKGGIKVAARPAGDLKLKISGGDKSYSLQDLEKGKPYVAEVFYQGNKLTGKELEKVKLTWDPNTSFAEVKYTPADDHFDLTLHHKDSKAPGNTVCGKCQVSIDASYAAQGSEASNAKATLNYKITDDFVPVNVDLFAKDDYIVISELDKSEAIVATLSMNGKPLNEQDFKNLKLEVDCGRIDYELTPDAEQSRYLIKLKGTKDIGEGNYTIKATATYSDHIGRQTQSGDELSVTLSNTPLWVKWLIGILLLLLIIFLIWKILHIRVLPKRVRHVKDNCEATLTGKNVRDGSEFNAKRSGKQISVKTGYNGDYIGFNINNIKPGKDSYLYKPQHKRSILVSPDQVRMSFGEITYLDINGVSYIYDKKEEKLVPEDPEQIAFVVKNDSVITYDGIVMINGKTKKFHSEIPITFKK